MSGQLQLIINLYIMSIIKYRLGQFQRELRQQQRHSRMKLLRQQANLTLLVNQYLQTYLISHSVDEPIPQLCVDHFDLLHQQNLTTLITILQHPNTIYFKQQLDNTLSAFLLDCSHKTNIQFFINLCKTNSLKCQPFFQATIRKYDNYLDNFSQYILNTDQNGCMLIDQSQYHNEELSVQQLEIFATTLLLWRQYLLSQSQLQYQSFEIMLKVFIQIINTAQQFNSFIACQFLSQIIKTLNIVNFNITSNTSQELINLVETIHYFMRKLSKIIINYINTLSPNNQLNDIITGLLDYQSRYQNYVQVVFQIIIYKPFKQYLIANITHCLKCEENKYNLQLLKSVIRLVDRLFEFVEIDKILTVQVLELIVELLLQVYYKHKQYQIMVVILINNLAIRKFQILTKLFINIDYGIMMEQMTEIATKHVYETILQVMQSYHDKQFIKKIIRNCMLIDRIIQYCNNTINKEIRSGTALQQSKKNQQERQVGMFFGQLVMMIQTNLEHYLKEERATVVKIVDFCDQVQFVGKKQFVETVVSRIDKDND